MNQRRSPLRASLLVTLLGLLVSSAHASPEGVCKKDDLVAVRKALASIGPDLRATLTLRGLTEACERSLPAGLAKGIYALQDVAPPDRALIVARLLSELVPFATAACPSFIKTFSAVATVAPADKGALMYRGCKYETLGLATEAEYVQAARTDFALALLAPPYFTWLVSNKMDKDAARRWMRDVLGLK